MHCDFIIDNFTAIINKYFQGFKTDELAKVLLRIIIDIGFHFYVLELKNPFTSSVITLLWIYLNNDYFDSKVKYIKNRTSKNVDMINTKIHQQKALRSLSYKLLLILLVFFIVPIMNLDASSIRELIETILYWKEYILPDNKTIMESFDTTIINLTLTKEHEKSQPFQRDYFLIKYRLISLLFTSLLLVSLLEWKVGYVLETRSISYTISESYHLCFSKRRFNRVKLYTLYLKRNDSVRSREKYENKLSEFKAGRLNFMIGHGLSLLLIVILMISLWYFKYISFQITRLISSVSIILLCPITTEKFYRTKMDIIQDIIHILGMLMFCYVPIVNNIICIQKTINMISYFYLFASLDGSKKVINKYRITTEAKIIRNAIDIWLFYWIKIY
jgi:hypothetical protein